MKKITMTFLSVALSVTLIGGFSFAQQDAKGCKDYPLFSRMEGYRIVVCRNTDFDAEDFTDPTTQQKVTIEGKKFHTEYATLKPFEGKYSRLQVSRNYANAITKIGGIAFEKTPKDPSETSMKLIKDGKELWAKLQYNFGANYLYLTIVEKQAMSQEVVADARFMAEGISSTGHVAIYGIYFDFNKSDVKPESDTALQEINKLLSGNPNLKVFIVGHTDNIGGVDYNMKLSHTRADAVVKVLTTKYKVNPQRLKAYGVGQLAPVAPNKTEDGRAKNRRVELVEQ